MEIETLITVIALGITYVVLLSCIWSANKQIANLNHQLQGLIKEYKLLSLICEAATKGDYKTAGILRQMPRTNELEKLMKQAHEEEKTEEPSGLTLTQHG